MVFYAVYALWWSSIQDRTLCVRFSRLSFVLQIFLMRQSLPSCFLTRHFWRCALNFHVDGTNRLENKPKAYLNQCFGMELKQTSSFPKISVLRLIYDSNRDLNSCLYQGDTTGSRVSLNFYDPEDCSPMCVLATGKGQREDYLWGGQQ